MSLIACSGVRPLTYRIGTQFLQKSSNQRIFQIPNLQRLLSATSSSASSSTLLKQNYENSHVSPTSGEQAPSPEPFVKNLFLGKFDKSNLVYPEISNNEELDELNQMHEQVERFFLEEVDSQKIDHEAHIPEDTLKMIAEMGLFGQQVPTKYGGLGLNATKYARLAEATALDSSIAVTLAAHQSIGLKGILLFGNEEQKMKYLPKLAAGEEIAAFCLTEPSSGSDAASIQTRATLSEDGKTYLLNGGKIWISNGGIADVFTVFARTELINDKGEKVDKVTAFIVERKFGGITNGKPEDKLGIRGSNTCEVHFENTPVPVENVIGQVGEGFKIAVNILNSGRFSMGSSNSGALKKLLASTTEHAITRSQFGKKLYEFGIIKEKLANIAVNIYVMESMAYMTSGIIDSYPDVDVSLEAAIVKIFSSEKAWDSTSECLQILGGLGYMKEYPYQRSLRDCRICMIFEGTNEILRLFVGLTGLKHAGVSLKELIKKLRNPLNNPGLLFRTIYSNMRNQVTEPKITHELAEAVHPSLKTEADMLEKCTAQFKKIVEIILARHGNKIVDQQLDVQRIADIAIDLYAMTSCIARASRSYSIGLRNADHEITITKTFCAHASQRIGNKVQELSVGSVMNYDENLRQISDRIISARGYAAEHPLTRNW
ncbi:complex I assembly factor ACAD9, mitochondrial [Octopus bimaculoides]|uniref:Acyl-CoA dehydrogenase family member 9, mitochondrial n=1 Tax=Octopus bimaculoides TaxID=37653 RepID=A0A0L8I854_OCTBM|nr:complex I assembly factor ACAD9, mitochondrial [Octopus bimaculoides]|eukprot:XP_014790047.1 PREDICTED: acyl-CoA dehydrogenase family member 9, mitochondrial-like [Octopus bimaculoides]